MLEELGRFLDWFGEYLGERKQTRAGHMIAFLLGMLVMTLALGATILSTPVPEPVVVRTSPLNWAALPHHSIRHFMHDYERSQVDGVSLFESVRIQREAWGRLNWQSRRALSELEEDLIRLKGDAVKYDAPEMIAFCGNTLPRHDIDCTPSRTRAIQAIGARDYYRPGFSAWPTRDALARDLGIDPAAWANLEKELEP